MLTLIVRQSLKNGTAKTWKLRSSNSAQTFGSSRLADVISIAPTTKGIQGIFEFRDNQWWYVNMDMQTGAKISGSPALLLNKEQTLEMEDCTLSFTPVKRESDLYQRLETVGRDSSAMGVELGKQFQLYMVKQSGRVLETRILPVNKKFKPAFSNNKVACIPSPEWHRQMVDDVEVSQRTLSLEDAARLARFSPSQLVDQDSKKGVILMLGAAAFFITVAIFSPKSSHTVAETAPPKVAQKIIVKTELKPKRKKSEVAKPAQQVVVKQAPAAAGPKAEMPTGGGGGKIANMMKSISGGRISQLIGKVSAQGAKSANVVFANGVKAGAGPSGRALAAVGNMERSGRDWGAAGTGTGVMISTNGKGGGKNASGMGGLVAGGTGSGGVGLIEEESEIIGGLDREIIAQYIKSKLGQILYCYERQLSANPDLFGKVAVKFTIGPTGSVEQQLIGDTTLKNATVEGCILNRVAAWKFPNPQGGTRVLVTYPFLFKSTN
ncbi:AgmX/PglI C-terminal domain-containing protein [Bdellovibrio svalbardensis]|uniref:AgmX/PglI C-terminal domain-containing protein n=1 Tax=Bdellovibrio svalbardensis TaxID=2972972 RepID=A0ABT6DL02_9BACT|nr:AgmX/PglI C-terminal domain-containing protein [Bdellovibrio svalbardensis]MDG0817555.1 AgmX/PglI C-terminal domain-containing protein [Bdellovibrio svalbardensis]